MKLLISIAAYCYILIGISYSEDVTTAYAKLNQTELNNFAASDRLLSACRLRPDINSPQEFENVQTHVNFSLYVDRFLAIDDIQESIRFTGSLTLDWFVPCIQQQYVSGSWPQEIDGLLREDPQKYWWPDFVMRNALSAVSMLDSSDLAKRLLVTVSSGWMSGTILGVFEGYCDLDFLRFPFDTQTCYATFFSQQDRRYVIYDGAVFFNTEPGCCMAKNSNWRFVDRGSTVIPNVAFGCDEVDFAFTIIRQPEYVLLNLFAPSLILGILQLTTFLLPHDAPDRPAFASTVMLSIFVLQGQILACLPKTPKPIIAAYFVLGQFLFALFCAFYVSAMCCFMMFFRKKAERRVRLFGQCYYLHNIIDLLALGFATSLLFLLNLAVAFFIL